MKKRFIIFYVAAFCIIVGLSFAKPAFSAILFYEDFEDALITEAPKDWAYSTHGLGSQELTTEQIRAGSSAYKFSCTGTSSDLVRQEITLRNAFNNGSSLFTVGDEYWIGFSIFLADGYYRPIRADAYLIHHQYHSKLDGPPTCDWTEGIRNPILTIMTKDSKWVSRIQWDTQLCTPVPKVGVHTRTYTSYDAFSTGQWYDFVINVKWSFSDDGFLKIWKDGVLVTDRTGGTCFNDVRGPFLKIGIYARIDQDQTVTIYYDELRIGDSSSSYSEVAPGGSVKPSPPTNVEAK